MIVLGIPGKPGLDGERGAVGLPGPTGSQVSNCKIIKYLLNKFITF